MNAKTGLLSFTVNKLLQKLWWTLCFPGLSREILHETPLNFLLPMTGGHIAATAT